jgi:Ca2+-binding EF-hand superfamily protein
MRDLKDRLSAFWPDMPHSELSFLLGDAGAKDITLGELKELLVDNAITNFDPVAEAFKVYDPAGTGYADMAVMRDVFTKLGFDTLTEDDIQVLLDTADADGDGRISLDDFRAMLRSVASRPASAFAQRRSSRDE